MFAEVYRVLAPGGRFMFSHTAQGPSGQPYYPVPWARDPSYSFLGTPEEILSWLNEAGLRVIENRMASGGSGSVRERSADELGPAAGMGDDMPERQANAVRSVKDGRLIGMLVLAERPV
jgi:hypothetical protein